MKLYSYYRSTAAYRVRIALNFKGLNYQTITVDLTQNQQNTTDYKAHNPQGRVPTLIDGNFELGQSIAILEYLEEKVQQPALLPKNIEGRAWVRFFSQIIACDMHPLNNLGSLKFLREKFNRSEEEVLQWYHHWLKQGFDTLETLLQKNKTRKNFCYGDSLSFADVCLIPQVYNANRFNFSMKNYPLICEINDFCLQIPCFEKANPDKQPDAPVKASASI